MGWVCMLGTMLIGYFTNSDAFIIVSGLFAIAGAIQEVAYKIDRRGHEEN